ncbi:MAG: hypothetical protein ACR2Q3_02020 [Woeseiaceae bacterium]
MNVPKTMSSLLILLVPFVLLFGCASGPPELLYPAFVNVDELDNVFIAGLPGARAKQLAGDPRSRRSSNRVRLPADWNFTTGAAPSQSVEVFVLSGEIELGEFTLESGGYAYLPPGTSGFPMRSVNGARILYFVDEANESAVIQTPLIASSALLAWQPTTTGFSIKELRADPGSGVRTWLLKIEPGATKSWQRSTQTVEGYLLSGAVMETECNGTEPVTSEYYPGGYFYRPGGNVSGGPESTTTTGGIWFLRVRGSETIETVAGCLEPEEQG